MTTGNIKTPPGPWGTSSGTNNVCFERTWTGSDGKVEMLSGTPRLKWNNYTTTVHSRLCTKASWRGRRNNGTTFTVANGVTILIAPDMSATMSANEQSKLLDKLLSKVRGHEFNLAVNLGQMGETVSMLAGSLNQLGLAFINAKKGNWTGAVRALKADPRGKVRFKSKDISGRWLELQYGWLPTVSDSYEAAKAFEEISMGPRRALFKVSGTRKISQQWSYSQIEAEIAGSVGRKIYFEMAEELSFARQLGLLDPLSVAWELLPYSFVVDWFIPIGTYLSNLNQIPSLKGRFLTIDRVQYPRQHVQWTDIPQTGSTGYASGISYPDVYYHSTKLTRVPSTALSVPRPNFDFRGAIHGNRLWNAISLAHQRFRS